MPLGYLKKYDRSKKSFGHVGVPVYVGAIHATSVTQQYKKYLRNGAALGTPVTVHTDSLAPKDQPSNTASETRSGVVIDSSAVKTAVSLGLNYLTPSAVSRTSYKMYKRFNKLDAVGLQGGMIENGLTKEFIERHSETALKSLQNQAYKRACVFFGIGSAVLVVEQYMFPRLSLPQRFFIAASVGLVFLFAYMIGQKAKIFS